MLQHLLLSRPAEGVAVLAFNRPEARNAIDTAAQAELDGALHALEADDGVRAVIVTGSGERAFCAGYDIREMQGFSEDQILLNYLERQQWVWYLANYPKPLIAAVNGLAHGGGAILAAAMDIRVGCSRSEFRFTAAAYNGVNNTWQLPQVVGVAKAKEFVMTARPVPAEEALQAGLLNHLVADSAVMDKALELARQIAANAPAAVRLSKQLIDAAAGRSIADRFAAENALMSGEMRPGRPGRLFDKFLKSHDKN